MWNDGIKIEVAFSLFAAANWQQNNRARFHASSQPPLQIASSKFDSEENGRRWKNDLAKSSIVESV